MMRYPVAVVLVEVVPQIVIHSLCVRPEDVRAADLGDAELNKYVREAPHIEFTPEMRALSASIAGTEANPYLTREYRKGWEI